MKKGSYLLNLFRSKQSVFSVSDIMLIWGENNSARANVRIAYYLKENQLYHIRRGFYAKDKNYDRLELGTKILTPSYVSFETVLLKEGIIFQYHQEIFVASYTTRKIEVDKQAYFYQKVKNQILLNSSGIKHGDTYSIASPERAFLDIVYLNKEYYFDNLAPLNWEKVYEILPIYNNKRMTDAVKRYHLDFREKYSDK